MLSNMFVQLKKNERKKDRKKETEYILAVIPMPVRWKYDV